MNEYSAKWIIDSVPLPPGNSIGIKNGTRQSYTIYRVDLKQLIGNDYDKFEYFKLNLLRISQARYDLLQNLPLNNPEDANLNFNISGLNFINPNNKNGSHKLASFQYDVTSLKTSYFDDNYVIFSKTNYPTVVFYFTRVSDDAVPQSVFTTMLFYLSISGVELN